MPALTLNGITVPVDVRSWEQPAPAVLGDRGRGTSGRSESAIRKRKRLRRGRTTALAKADAEALGHLLEGEGDAWGFDSNLYSARGLGPSLADTSSVVGLFQKWGAGAVQVGPPSSLQYSVGSSGSWTVMYWKRPIDFFYGLPSVTDHFLHTSTGLNYRNGVSFTPVTTGEPHDRYVYASCSGGLLTLHSVVDVIPYWDAGDTYSIGDLVVTIGFSGAYRVFAVTGGSGFPGSEPDWDSASGLEDSISDGNLDYSDYDVQGYAFYDELVFLPFAVPSSWAAQLYAEHSTRAWTSPPYVRAAGDLVNPAAVVVKGKVTGVTPVAHKRAGTFERGGQALAFELMERG